LRIVGSKGRGPAHGKIRWLLFVDCGMEKKSARANADLTYAIDMVHATCCLAGSASYLDDLRADLRDRGVVRAVRDHDTPALFDWLIKILSFQGISDSVASEYIVRHGSVRWSDISAALSG
jgi:hypothetical protein